MNRANPVVIGAFVVGAIGLMILGVVTFGTIQFFAPTIPVVMVFKGSAKGLSVGAPIDFRGVPVGEVTEIRGVIEEGLKIDIVVFGEINPKSMSVGIDVPPPKVPGQYFSKFIDAGLRAYLETQSILTGQKFVALEFQEQREDRSATEAAMHEAFGDYHEIPTIPSPFDVVKEHLSELLTEIQELPLKELVEHTTATIDKFGKTADTANTFMTEVGGDATELTASASKAMADAQGAVDRVNAILEDIQRTEFIDNTNATVVDVGALARNANVKIDVLTEQVKLAVASFEQASTSFQSALNKAKETMAVAEGVIEPGSDIHRSLVVTLNDIAAAARDISETAVSIRILTDYLGQNPESVIFGKPAGEQ
jgi:paraquat-inducible protein B